MSEKEWKNIYKALRQKVFTSDKERNLNKVFPLNRTSTLKNEIMNMTKQEEKGQFSRDLEQKRILDEIKVLKQSTNDFKEKLKVYDKTPQYLSRIQEISEQLEQKYTQFKSQQMEIFDDLAAEEDILTHELQLFNERLTYLESSKVSTDNQDPSQKNQIENPEQDLEYQSQSMSYFTKQQQQLSPFKEQQGEDLGQENNFDISNQPTDFIEHKKHQIKLLENNMVKAKQKIDVLQKQMSQNGGSNCGWNNEDQKEFLRLKTKHKGQIAKLAFLNDCKVTLAYYEESQLKDHIEKYLKFQQIDDDLKKLLNDYKQQKEDKNQLYKELAELEQEQSEVDVKKEQERQQQLKQEQMKKKEQIKQWKLREQAKKEVEKETEWNQQKEVKEEEQRLLRMKQDQLKSRVKEYQEQKKIDKLKEQERQEFYRQLQKRPLTSEEKCRIKEKEDMLLSKKIQTINKKEEIKLKKQEQELKKAEENKIKYSYLEPQLTQMTQAAVQQKKEKFDGKSSKQAETFGGSVVRFTGRAVPVWRQGL